MSFSASALGWRWLEACRDPQRHQRALLAELLARHRTTAFGSVHGLTPKMTYRDFVDAVPIRRYGELQGWLERAVQGEPRVLTTDPPHWFSRSSGTTGSPKYFPITREGLRAFQTVRDCWFFRTLEQEPAAARGFLLLLSSPEEEEALPGGAVALRQSVLTWVPPTVTFGRGLLVPKAAASAEARRQAVLEQALRHDVSMIVATSPSTISVFLEDFAARGRKIGRTAPVALDAWPGLALLACWTQGPSAVFAERVQELSGGVPTRDIGLAASEGYFAVPLERGGPSILAAGAYVIELVPADDEPGEPVPWDEVASGEHYRLVVTTPSGLWRYDTEDVVEVTGRFERTPGVAFRRRAGSVVSIAGEKVTELQVIEAVRACAAEWATELVDFTCGLAWPRDAAPRYRFSLATKKRELDVRALSMALEATLCTLNGEYRSRRSGGRLAPVEVEQVTRCVRPPTTCGSAPKPRHLLLDLPESMEGRR